MQYHSKWMEADFVWQIVSICTWQLLECCIFGIGVSARNLAFAMALTDLHFHRKHVVSVCTCANSIKWPGPCLWSNCIRILYLLAVVPRGLGLWKLYLESSIKWFHWLTASQVGCLKVFSCDQAALQMVFSVCPSVRLSVRPSLLFDYVPIIVSSWNF